MNLQQASQARPSANGYGRRRQDREVGGGGAGGGARADHYRSQSSKIVSNRSSHAGGLVSRKIGGPSGDRLLYLATCLIGHPVEVQVKNGSLYTGIFHATNAEKDFGIILKMAHMSKDGTKGQKSDGGFLSKPPLKTLIIHANELVQIIAKDVPVTSDGFNEVPQEKQQELMLDSYISQSRQADGERVLEPWVPDEDDPHYPELDNTFDTRWNRKWDQFETNEMLFGVKSTFNEELYTTKLERGPQTRELEKEASRIAREIEGEVTQDLHLAEERGLQLHEDFDVDEETRFSSVFRGRVADDSGYGEDEDILFNSRNTDTFGDSDAPITTGFSDGMTFEKTSTGVPPSGSCSVEDRKTYASVHQTDSHTSGILDQTRQPSSSVSCGTCTSAITGSRVQESSCSDLSGENDSKVQIMGQHLNVEAQTLQSGADSDAQSSANGKKDASDGGASSSGAVVHPSPSEGSLKDPEETRSTNDSERTASGKRTHAEPPVKTNQRPSSSRSSISDHVGATSSSIATGLTPSSSVGSLSSEKSTLNPNAKEFKLNPNAKSFVPSQTPVRPPSPVSDASFYVPTNMASVQHMHGMPAGVGITPQFVGHQPVIFNPQFPPIHSPQGYLHTSAPQQYGQHMMFGHPRQVPYMSSYPPEMPYKGRDF